MKKILMLVLTVAATLGLAACGDRRYGEGDVVEVLINPAHDTTQQFMNLHLFNHSNDNVVVVIEGFEYLDGDNWILIPPVSEAEWVQNNSTELSTEDGRNRAGTVLGFEYWLNPDYPTEGTFRVSARVYDISGAYLFTQGSNVRELEGFSFE